MKESVKRHEDKLINHAKNYGRRIVARKDENLQISKISLMRDYVRMSKLYSHIDTKLMKTASTLQYM